MRFATPLIALALAGWGCTGADASRPKAPEPAASAAQPAPPAAAPAPAEPLVFSTPPPTAALGAPAWLGVAMDNGGDLGVRVESVVRGSPAERAGVQPGDRIVSIEGAHVTAPAHVSQTVTAHKAGDTVMLGIERTGNAITAAVVLASRPAPDDMLRMHLVGAPAPAWSNAVPLTGAPASIASLKGKVVIIDFWATWCGPCRMIAPRLSALKDRLGAQGLAVVGVTTDPAEQAAVFAEQHQMRYPSVVDKAGDTSRAYNITALPTLVLVDKRGIVRDVFVGFGKDELETAVKKLLAEPGPAAIPTPSVSRPDGR